MSIRFGAGAALFLFCFLPAGQVRAEGFASCQSLKQKAGAQEIDWCQIGGENVFFVNGSWKKAAASGIRYSERAQAAGRILERFERPDFFAGTA
ncbi:MAG TPA: hypothetical protein VL688_07155 [Verrucomicrobiae bacterium]|nr:hypothetical protein [Verrucomicrobiae bacterium]